MFAIRAASSPASSLPPGLPFLPNPNHPAVSEPWFLAFNADVEFRIVMTPEDLRKAGLGDVGRKWPKAA